LKKPENEIQLNIRETNPGIETQTNGSFFCDFQLFFDGAIIPTYPLGYQIRTGDKMTNKATQFKKKTH